MSEVLDRPNSSAEAEERNEHIVVDGSYVREQANEAARLFLAPVSGIVRALVERKERKGARKRAA